MPGFRVQTVIYPADLRSVKGKALPGNQVWPALFALTALRVAGTCLPWCVTVTPHPTVGVQLQGSRGVCLTFGHAFRT
jgi:hypothetical protein